MRAERSVAARLLILALPGLVHGTACAAIEAQAQPARQFGFTIGDMIHQTVRLAPAHGQTLIEDSLPKEGRAGTWFERRHVDAVREGSTWRIEIDYQLINSPPELRTIALPALRLEMRDANDAARRVVEELLAEAPLTAAPLTPAVVLARAGLDEMRPDTPPPLIDTGARLRRLALYALAAGLICLSWAAWYFGFDLRGRRKRPFAQAERKMRRALAGSHSPDALREAMRSLHRAFDATAGATLFAASLDAFLERHGAFAPARDGIAQFFEQSRRAFFESDSDGNGRGSDAAQLLALAGRLKALEREGA